jgi:hypothetical protein
MRELSFRGDTARKLYHARVARCQNHLGGNLRIAPAAHVQKEKRRRLIGPRRSMFVRQFTVIVFVAV